MKGEDFEAFVRTELVPQLRSGHVVVMDNLKIHKRQIISELVASTGARIEYLPVGSPDFNPIEMLWSVMKAFVRGFKTQAMDALEKLVQVSLRWVDKGFFRNWLTKCCYCTS
jgi:transposase